MKEHTASSSVNVREARCHDHLQRHIPLDLIRGTFHACAVVILTITSIAKLLAIAGQRPILWEADPVFMVPNVVVLWGVSVVEFAIALALLAPLSPRRKALLICWISSSFILYRVTLAWLKPGAACLCLGTLSDWIPLSSGAVNALLVSSVLILFLGAVVELAAEAIAHGVPFKLKPAR